MNFMPFPTKENLRMLILWWLCGMVVLLWRQWQSKRAAGLPLAYAFALTISHLIAACVYAVPGYQPRSALLVQGQYSLLNTFTGFYVSLIGFLCYVLGCLVCPILFNKSPTRLLKRPVPELTTDLPGTLLLLSLLFFFVMRPIMNRISGLQAIASSGTYISVVAVLFIIFQAYQMHDHKKITKWILATFAFPFVTVITIGFAGYGSLAAITIWVFVLRFYRPRWVPVVIFPVILFLGLSVYINYMRERDSIRASVWGGRDLSTRLTKFANMYSDIEWFSSLNQRHLEMIDLRLNQNELVGKAVVYVESGRVQMAEGGTFAAAAVAWIPRILWPNKPATGGSGTIVSRYTGTKFAEGTSVGVGQVLEFYINWKLPSVIIGFFIFGILTTFMDQKAGAYMNQGDLWNAARWLVPGLGMLQAGGSSTEIVSSVAGGAVFMWVLNHYVFGKYYDDRFAEAPRSMSGGDQQVRGSRVPRSLLRH